MLGVRGAADAQIANQSCRWHEHGNILAIASINTAVDASHYYIYLSIMSGLLFILIGKFEACVLHHQRMQLHHPA